MPGIGSFLGLLLQIGLVVLVVFFRHEVVPPAPGAGLCGPPAGLCPVHAGAIPRRRRTWGAVSAALELERSWAVLAALWAAWAAVAGCRAASWRDEDEIGIGEKDYAAFERTLVERAGRLFARRRRGDLELATPEMAGYIQEELNDNAARGVVNRSRTSSSSRATWPRLGAKARRTTPPSPCASGLNDVTDGQGHRPRRRGRSDQAVEATELWTFRRDRADPGSSRRSSRRKLGVV